MFYGMLEAMLLAALIGHSGEMPVPSSHCPEPPLTMTLTGPESFVTGRELELVLEITRMLPDEVPIRLHVALPDGVVLLSGPRESTFVDPASRVVTRRLRFHVTRVPTGDVVVTVAARSRIYGVHATATYRFGRAPTPLVRPPVGPELRGPGGTRLGRPVLLDRTPKAPTRR